MTVKEIFKEHLSIASECEIDEQGKCIMLFWGRRDSWLGFNFSDRIYQSGVEESDEVGDAIPFGDDTSLDYDTTLTMVNKRWKD